MKPHLKKKKNVWYAYNELVPQVGNQISLKHSGASQISASSQQL